MHSILVVLLCVWLSVYCSALIPYKKKCEVIGDVTNPSPSPDTQSPELFHVILETNVINSNSNNHIVPGEPILIEVNRSWAPLGADRFYSLVRDGFYNQAAFFRVVPNFVVQFGISSIPAETSKWNTTIPDDPVLTSNTNWTVSFATAGPNTRTSQLFINYIDNSRLDSLGFAPFGRVLSGFGTALVIANPTPNDSNGVDQDMYSTLGNEWILKEYPDINIIMCTSLITYPLS